MKKLLTVVLAAVLFVLAFTGCGGSGAPAAAEAPAASEVTWEDYIDWLASTIGADSPDPDDYRATLAQAKSWADVDPASPPWDRILDESAFNASTWDEFVAAGGVGTYNTDYEDSAGSGGPSGNPPADRASGEPTGEPPAAK